MNFPENLKYSKDHEWIRFEGEIAYVGITDYAQKELGEIVYVDITTEGEDLEQNDVFGSVEAVKTVSDLMLPTAGKIEEINAKLEDQPELVNTDPYGEGWIIKVALKNPSDTTAGLLSSSEYRALINL